MLSFGLHFLKLFARVDGKVGIVLLKMLTSKPIVSILVSAATSVETEARASLLSVYGGNLNTNMIIPANHIWTGAPSNFAAAHNMQKHIARTPGSFAIGNVVYFPEEPKYKLTVEQEEVEMEKICLTNSAVCQVTVKVPRSELASIDIAKIPDFTLESYFKELDAGSAESKCVSGGEFSF
ncbi:hypothetical protein DSO57_1016949 [Entomophthora muscae]|uniref:Uncharacterized protein n=1 Tax=Entomophthora muscae TaxID=34485 RepID=A0ACC2TFL0_9FUNG|nr:hypothetical protein DSO57_1016949 [Entomophthora muscae]